MGDYADDIANPKWQKQRLQILDRDGWACRQCGAKDDTLHVHHGAYVYGKKIYEYPDSWLFTLCKACHTDVGAATASLKVLLATGGPWIVTAAERILRCGKELADYKRDHIARQECVREFAVGLESLSNREVLLAIFRDDPWYRDQLEAEEPPGGDS